MKKHIYPEKLEEFIKEGHNYIPRKLKFREHLKLFKRYWLCYSDSYLKVDQIYNIENVEYYSVKFPNSLFGQISYPLDEDSTFELMLDSNNVENVDNIINTKVSYSGAEIKFWFFIKNIDMNSEKYCGFWSFIEPNSKSVISDDKYYFLYAFYSNDIYKKCKVSLDRNRK